MKANALNAQRLIAALLEELVKEEHVELLSGTALVESSKWAITTSPAGISEEAAKKLSFLFPSYFGSS